MSGAERVRNSEGPAPNSCDMMERETEDSQEDVRANPEPNSKRRNESKIKIKQERIKLEWSSDQSTDEDGVDVEAVSTGLQENISPRVKPENTLSDFQVRERPFPSSSNGRVRKRPRRCSRKSSTGSTATHRRCREYREKLALISARKWTRDMEKRWKLMKADKEKFSESFVERQKLLIKTPEKHERYGQEWTAFWERRYDEVENEGLDPENYDYVPEWKKFWNRRMKKLLVREYAETKKKIKKKHGMDFQTLAKLRCKQEGIQPVAVVKLEQPSVVPPPPVEVVQLEDPSVVTLPLAVVVQLEEPSVVTPPPVAVVKLEQPSVVALPPQPLTHTSPPMKPIVPVTAGKNLTSGKVRSTSGDSTKPTATSSAKVTAQPSTTSVAHIDGSSNDSSCVATSYDFDGYDIPQILTLMVDVEEKLARLNGRPSRFAAKIQEYFKKAENLELKNCYAAQLLLNDKIFVALMFTLHDRYMKRIRKNVLPRDVLGPLNHIVYALDAMLESPRCQPYRSKLATGEASIGSDSELEEATIDPLAANRVLTADEEIARLLAGFLMTNGMSAITDSDLRYFVGRMLPSLTPTAAESQAASASSRNPPVGTNAGNFNVPAFSQLRIDPNGVPLHGTAEPIYNRRTENVASSSAGSSFSYHPGNYMQSSGPPGTSGRGWGSNGRNGANLMPSQNSGWGRDGRNRANLMPPQNSGWVSGGSRVPSFGHVGMQPNVVPLQMAAEPIYNRRTGNVASSSAGSSLSYPPANYMQSPGLPGSGWRSTGRSGANWIPPQSDLAPSLNPGRAHGLNPAYPY